MNDKGEFWPMTFITIQMNTPEKQLSLKAEMERTRLGVKLNFPKDSQDAKDINLRKDIQDSKDIKSKEPIYLESTLEGRDIDLRVLHQNVQLSETDPEWLRWLIEALERGSVTRGKVYLAGPVNQLDWHGEIAFHNVNLLYNKDWPKIRRANGKVIIQKDKVKVQVFSGNILGSPLKQVEALIAPIGGQESPELRIEGALSGRVENGIKFLLLSPLKKTLGEHLSLLKPSGLMDLHLNLKIPLGNAKNAVEVQDN